MKHFNKERKRTDETRKKISEALKKQWTNGARRGHPLSEEHKRKLLGSLNRKLNGMNNPETVKKWKESFKPEHHWSWKGGISKKLGWKCLKDKKRLDQLRKIRELFGAHTNGEWETLKAQYNWTCLSCKKKEPEIKLEKDHIIPICKGGSDNIENIQPLCGKCNQRKNWKTIKY